MYASPLGVVRRCFDAYVAKDRATIEALIADDYHFTSPIDNALDRATYFAVCWPNSELMAEFEFVRQLEDGERAFVVYEARTNQGKAFRNSEMHTVRNGKLVSTEVYFGWDLPHKAPPGTHIENQGEGHA